MNQSPIFRNKLIASNIYIAPDDCFQTRDLAAAYNKLDRFDKPGVDRKVEKLSRGIHNLGQLMSLEILACLVREGLWYPEEDER